MTLPGVSFAPGVVSAASSLRLFGDGVNWQPPQLSTDIILRSEWARVSLVFFRSRFDTDCAGDEDATNGAATMTPVDDDDASNGAATMTPDDDDAGNGAATTTPVGADARAVAADGTMSRDSEGDGERLGPGDVDPIIGRSLTI